MRILVYTQRIGKRTINFIHNEILTLDKKHDVLVLSHFISNENPIQLNNLQYIRHYENRLLGKGIGLLRKAGLPIPSFEKDLNQWVDEFQPQVIHIHFGNIAIRVLDYFQRTDIPIFISFHGYDASQKLQENKYVHALNLLFKKPNIHPIFVSNFMLKNIQAAGVQLRGYDILYYGTDISKFQREVYNNSKTPFTFLQISSFAEKKGHQVTLHAYRSFLDQNPKIKTQLVLGGGGDGMESIQQLCKKLNLENYVHFKGWINIDEAKTLMDQAHAFLHHSIIAKNGDMEGIPNAIMEAMAMELPVISTYHSGIPELVEDGINGFLVKEHDVDTYAQKMNEILDWNYKKENRKKVLEKFEKEQHGNTLLEIYKK